MVWIVVIAGPVIALIIGAGVIKAFSLLGSLDSDTLQRVLRGFEVMTVVVTLLVVAASISLLWFLVPALTGVLSDHFGWNQWVAGAGLLLLGGLALGATWLGWVRRYGETPEPESPWWAWLWFEAREHRPTTAADQPGLYGVADAGPGWSGDDNVAVGDDGGSGNGNGGGGGGTES